MRSRRSDKALSSSLSSAILYAGQKEYYRKSYESSPSLPWEKAFDMDWLKRTLNKLGDGKGKRALDIGAGKGRGSLILSASGYKTVGMDYLLPPLTAAHDICRDRRNRPSFVNADLFANPFRDRCFDLALDWGVFHHIQRKDTGEYLLALKRALKPGGVFLLGCFSTNFRHAGEGDRQRNWLVHKGHYDRFSTREELTRVFSPSFSIMSLAETRPGFYHISMKLRG
jgi:ubiquinone/menaquinone biosynthesis C-methylase UbiE